MPADTWVEELRANRVEHALRDLQQALKSVHNYPSNHYSLGAVYMWSGDCRSALAHFNAQITAALPRNPPADATYGMAGAAAWCLGDEELALKHWREGRTSTYAVAGANTRTSLLLYAASVLRPNAFSVDIAKKQLSEEAAQWRIKNWPGPVAQFILELATEQEVREKATGDNGDPTPKSWQLEFYKSLKAWPTSKSADRNPFDKLLDLKDSQYLTGENLFYFLRVEEFYLARHYSPETSH